VHPEELGGDRWHTPAIAVLFRRLNLCVTQSGWHCIVQALTIVENERVEVHDRAQPVRDAIGDPRDHAAAVRMAAEYDVGEVLPTHQIHDVSDVSLERYLRADPVRARGNPVQ